MIDYIFAIFLFFLITIYVYILHKNNLLFHISHIEIESVLNKKNSIILEIVIDITLVILTLLLYQQKQYLLMLVVVLELIEHINQIIFCYRQHLNSLNLITFILNIVFIIYAYYKKCYWVIPFFVIGASIHTISYYYDKSFLNIVCIKN
jgi:hypothetical protein